MFWWNYKKLAEALRSNAVKKWHLWVYYITFILGYVVLVPLYLSAGLTADTPIELAYNYALPVIGTLLWVVLTYRINASGDGQSYFKRLASLSFPISIRFLSIFLPIMLVAAIVSAALHMAELCPDTQDPVAFEACMNEAMLTFKPTVVDLLLYIIGWAFFIHWSRNAFLYVSGKKPL